MVGVELSANCYTPQKYVKRWSWETYWLVQASWCWLLWPIIGALLTIPQLWQVLFEAPKDRMLDVISDGRGLRCWRHGLQFFHSLHRIFADLFRRVGLSSILGTLVPPLVHGQIHDILSRSGSSWVLTGVMAGAVGIAICGAAGHSKERDLDAGQGTHAGFSLGKGLLLSLLAGVLSAVYGFALDAAIPIVDVAEQHGAGIWKGNVAYIFANTGAFVTSLIYCIYLMRKNKSSGAIHAASAYRNRRQPADELPPRVSDRHALVWTIFLLQPRPCAVGQGLCVFELGDSHDSPRADQQRGGHRFQGMERLRRTHQRDHRIWPLRVVCRHSAADLRKLSGRSAWKII